MKPRLPLHNIRRTIKWGGLGVTALLVGLWLGSNWWAFKWHPTSHTFVSTVGVGMINVGWIGPPLMSEAEWRSLPVGGPRESRQTYEQFIEESPFSAGYFRRNNRAFDEHPPTVWLLPWESGKDPNVVSLYIFRREKSGVGFRNFALANEYWRCSVLVWPLVMAGATITALAWWYHLLLFWRARPGFCRKCKYDLAGLAAESVCPECGESSVRA